MAVRVAVIGAGPQGLTALKNLREDGFDAVIFETRSWIGGLWKYSEDSSLSAAENTVFNTSKYRTAISDFPVPEDMDDFPTASQLQRYLESYCDHFDLRAHIHLSSPVKKVTRTSNEWTLEIAKEGEASRTEYFDKVVFACGPFIMPRQPKFDGISEFSGNTLHAINYHNPSQFEGQNVLVMGAHASAQDVVSSLSKYAQKAYLSIRSGAVLLPRYTNNGSVYDRIPPLSFTIITLYLSAWFPSFFNWIMDTLIRSISKTAFPDKSVLGALGTTKAPSIAVAPPLIASELYPHLQSGFCEAVSEIRRITGPRTVELKSGQVLEDIGVIIYCTGYHSHIPVPIEPEELNPYPYPGSPPRLYRNIFPLHPDVRIRESLAFLGQGAIPWPGLAQFELQGICVSQVWLGNSSLPAYAKMQRWHKDYLSWRKNMTKQYDAASTFYTAFVPSVEYMLWIDACAGLGLRHHFGLVGRWTHRTSWELWWEDRELYNLCLTGLASPAIFRLFDCGKRKAWDGARAQILIDNERVERQQRARLRSLAKDKKA